MALAERELRSRASLNLKRSAARPLSKFAPEKDRTWSDAGDNAADRRAKDSVCALDDEASDD